MTTSTSPVTGVDFVVVPTQDAERARSFYTDVLGLEFVKQWGGMPAYEVQAGNLTLALMQMDAFGREFRPNGGPIALQVEDFDAAHAALQERGVTFASDVIDSGVCKQAYFADPDGNPVGIHHRYAPKDAMPGDA
ncbi:MAG TPA: VOC family protein [Solirubrobacteraceae bacterium]|jgi:catechol 2,3-dioxygenase-like lactoylglutathione lyase family enzyme